MKKQITIEEIQEKTASNGKKYWTVSTSDGAMSTFDLKNADKLFGLVNKTCEVEVAFSKDGKFQNIVEVLGEVAGNGNGDNKIASVLTSYAKDLAIGMTKDVNELVKNRKVIADTVMYWYNLFSGKGEEDEGTNGE